MSIKLKIENNFSSSASNGTKYFETHYDDDEIWLFFLKTNKKISYTDANTRDTSQVLDHTAIQLSTVLNGTFDLETKEKSTKLYAGLGMENPFKGDVNGPGVFDHCVSYALAEWTILGNDFDNVDVSFIDTFSYPTTLTVETNGGEDAVSAGFKTGTTADDVIQKLQNKMKTYPIGPKNDNYPKPEDSNGYGPLVPTVIKKDKSRKEDKILANRWIGSSKYFISGPDDNYLRSMYLYAPSFDNYLKFLQENQTPLGSHKEEAVLSSPKGWFIDYSGNGGYSGYFNITGNETSGFGMEITDIRVNTKASAENHWAADPSAGTATIGKITIAKNGETLLYSKDQHNRKKDNYAVGAWTDAVIYSGAAVLGELGSGPTVTGYDDFAPDGAHSEIVATFLASISASIATGLLGNKYFLEKYTDQSNPKSTMYWFSTLKRDKSLKELFESPWENDQEFYDPFWATLASCTGNQTYLSPFMDRWSHFKTGFPLKPDDKIIWELGMKKE